MSNTLLPCPFCGGEAVECDIKQLFANGWVGCQRCRCFMDFVKNGKPLAIAAWNSRADHIRDTTKKVSNADRIRSMSDEELAVWILRSVDCDKENIMCIPALYKNSDKCDGRCRDGRLSWLKQPAKEEHYETD